MLENLKNKVFYRILGIMKDAEKREQFSPENGPEMVRALRIRTVYTDPKILEKIAEEVHSKGLVSGFSIEPIEAGYFHKGKRVAEQQYGLDFLIDAGLSEDKKEEILAIINREMKKKWDTPAITQEVVEINKDLLGFIQRAEVEHKKYRREKRIRLTLTLALLLPISAALGIAERYYAELGAERAAAAERWEEFQRLNKIHQKIDKQISDVEDKLSRGESLEKTEGVEFGSDQYREVREIQKTVEEGMDQVRKLIESDRKKFGEYQIPEKGSKEKED